MRVLGIETSCDETAAAVLGEDGVLLSNVVHSQVPVHQRFGGVVPEVASRQHLLHLEPVVRSALERAGVGVGDLDGISVTRGPGLSGCLLVGVSFAKALSWSAGKPLVGVSHLEGHLLAPFLTDDPPTFPFVGLLVSGGHTSLLHAPRFGAYRLLGTTRDDAAGEAFDKVGKLLGMGYPAGAEIDRTARGGDRQLVEFPRGMMRQPGLEFSFSGLKTAVLNHVREHGVPEGRPLADLCASFQEAVVDVLVGKVERAMKLTGCERLVVSGGVAANSRLRGRMEERCRERGWALHVPPLSLCSDNAAMIAWAGRERLMRGERAPQSLTASPGLPFGEAFVEGES